MRRLTPILVVFLFLVTACFSREISPTDVPSVDTEIPTRQFTAAPDQPTHSLLPESTPIPAPSQIILHRGVNMSNALEAPNEGEWGLYIYEEYFDLVKQAGFDFVRLPVTWNGHADESPPYAIDPSFFFRVDQVVEWALERDINIIIELHSYNKIMTDPWGQRDRFLSIWGQVSSHYQDYPTGLMFELLNEPNGEISASLWNIFINDALAVIRETNPDRDVVIGPVNWSTYDWVTTLDLPDDPHMIVTFHYYSPFDFTHQGAEWVEDSGPWLGTTWDASSAQKADITRDFNLVADWAERKGNIRILLGEFGVYSKADMESRIRWTTFVREQAEGHGFAWTYWEFGAGFGVYDPVAGMWQEDLLKALVP